MARCSTIRAPPPRRSARPSRWRSSSSGRCTSRCRETWSLPMSARCPSVEQVELRVDEEPSHEAAQEIVSRLTAARNPVLIVGVEVHRFHLTPKVLELAERLQIPVTSSFLGRGVFPTRHPQFIGTYLGGVSPQPLREIVESSDCLLLLGELISDTSLGVSADRINEDNLIVCAAREVFIKYHQFQHAPLDMLVDRLLVSDLPVEGAPRRGGRHRRLRRGLRSLQAGRADQDEARDPAGQRVPRAASRLSRWSPIPAIRCLPASISDRATASRPRTTQRWALRCRRGWVCRLPAGDGRSFSSETAPFK